jgi:hypothetical protein
MIYDRTMLSLADFLLAFDPFAKTSTVRYVTCALAKMCQNVEQEVL